MYYRIMTVLICFLIVEGSWAQDELLKKAQGLFKPIPDTPLALDNNPMTPEKSQLGKMLFFEPRLSASNLISCNTCHNLGTGGVDLQETSIGHGWQKGPRNAPTVLNSAFNIAQFWDGRAKDLEEQAKGPVQAGVEMNNTPDQVVVTLKSMPEYVDLFAKSFPDGKDPVTFDNMAKAIAVYETTLNTPNSRFDKYLKGDEKSLSDEEKEGLSNFINKGCAGCHNGINIGGSGYFRFGLVKSPGDDIRPPADKGRLVVTNDPNDEYAFRVCTLRNIELTQPYFHSGKVWSLKEAVDVMGTSQLGIQLTGSEVDSITAFLKTLTGEQPKVEYPILPPNTEKTPQPLSGVDRHDDMKH